MNRNLALALCAAALGLGALTATPAAAAKLVFDVSVTSQGSCIDFVCTPDASFTPFTKTVTYEWAPKLTQDFSTIVTQRGPSTPEIDPYLLGLSGFSPDDLTGDALASARPLGVAERFDVSTRRSVAVFPNPGEALAITYAVNLQAASHTPLADFHRLETLHGVFDMLEGLNSLGGYTWSAGFSTTDTSDSGVTQFGAGRAGTATFDRAASVIPEPAAWALMIAGLGLAGAALRRRAGVARLGSEEGTP
jgi:hypothetical protein